MTETKTVNDAVTAVYTYQYSTKGERTGKHITTNGATNVIAYYLYDGNGRLFQHDTGFSHPAGASCYFYFYDALGRRIKKDGGSHDADFTWSGDNVMAEMDTNGLTTDRYIYGVDGIAMNNSSYYFKNAHGDVVETIDNSTGIRGNYTYEAFGNKVTSPTDDTNPFQYCGEYMDDESFLIYLRNRYYDPEIGAFISEDPIYDGYNWYTYCENNPVNFVDPMGLSKKKNTSTSNGKIMYTEYYNHGCVNGQAINIWVKDLYYGNTKISTNGCELVAVFNALVLVQRNQLFEDIIEKAENTEDMLWFNGTWGSRPEKIGDLLYEYDVANNFTTDKSAFNDYIDHNYVYIISVWNEETVFGGIHTVTFTCDEDKNIVVYNRYSNSGRPYQYTSTEDKTGLDLFLEETGNAIILYEVGRK